MARWQRTGFLEKKNKIKMLMKINHFLRNFLQLHFPTSFTCKYPNAYLNKTERFLSAKLLWLELNITRRVKITSEPAGCGHVRAALPATSSRGPTTGTDRDRQGPAGTRRQRRSSAECGWSPKAPGPRAEHQGWVLPARLGAPRGTPHPEHLPRGRAGASRRYLTLSCERFCHKILMTYI